MKIQNTLHTIITNSFLATCVNVADNLKTDRPESKAAKCRKFFLDNPGLARKDYIAVFMKDFDMTKDGAGTYVQNFRTELKKAAGQTAVAAEVEADDQE